QARSSHRIARGREIRGFRDSRSRSAHLRAGAAARHRCARDRRGRTALPSRRMTDIPLTVIGGYLGSGKTTLLNEMLDRRDGRRIAVIVNDFGQISIDAQILGEREGRTWEIANGCI